MLTREQILKLTAGPRLDATIRQHIMGGGKRLCCADGDVETCFRDVEESPVDPLVGPTEGTGCDYIDDEVPWEKCPHRYIPPYSTDHNAAMEVVEHIREESQASDPAPSEALHITITLCHNGWVIVTLDVDGVHIETEALTLPVAICIAVLLWKLERRENEHAT